jgi:hypothetical protein
LPAVVHNTPVFGSRGNRAAIGTRCVLLGLIVIGADWVGASPPVAQVWPLSFQLIGDQGTVSDIPIRLRNTSTGAIQVVDFSPDISPPASLTSLPGDCPESIPAGTECVLATFRFTPTPAEPSAFVVHYTALVESAAGDRFRWTLSTSARPPDPSNPYISGFAVLPYVRIGYIELGQSAGVRVYLRNPLSQPITALVINDLAAYPETTRVLGDCITPIAPGAECLFATYIFSPVATAITNNNYFPSIGLDFLGIMAADGTLLEQRIQIEGSGGTPILGFEQASYDFGQFKVGSTPNAININFHNDGTAGYSFYPFEGTIGQLAFTGRFDLDNALSSCQGPLVTIAAGTTCSLVVNVSATKAGALSGTLFMSADPAVTSGKNLSPGTSGTFAETLLLALAVADPPLLLNAASRKAHGASSLDLLLQ